MRTIHVEVRGRVQGVGFRWFVRERAAALDLAGWVRNRPDGSVEIVARGPDGALDAMLADVRRGPPGAHVSAVHELPPSDDPSLPIPFAIHR